MAFSKTAVTNSDRDTSYGSKKRQRELKESRELVESKVIMTHKPNGK